MKQLTVKSAAVFHFLFTLDYKGLDGDTLFLDVTLEGASCIKDEGEEGEDESQEKDCSTELWVLVLFFFRCHPNIFLPPPPDDGDDDGDAVSETDNEGKVS